MNVLITGGAGFIGYHLAVSHQQRGDHLVILDNLFKLDGQMDAAFTALVGQPNVRYLPVDLVKPLDLTMPKTAFDIVYHLAAINGTRLFYEIPYQVARTNLLMTLQLLDWLEDTSVGRLVYASTSEVYAGCEPVGLLKVPTAEDTPVVFTQPTEVRFSYGTSKFMGEFLTLQFGRTHQVPTTVIRYHNVYGPRMGEKHVIPEFIARLQRQERPFRIYGGRQTRAFCYVDDAVAATHLAATTPRCAGEILHIGNAKEEVMIEAVARLLMKQADLELEIQECGEPAGSVGRRCPDTAKLQRLTGFEAAIPLAEGLAKTFAWYHDGRQVGTPSG